MQAATSANTSAALRYQSPILEALDRPVNPESRVESEERIRCVMMNALEEALASAARAGSPSAASALPLEIRMPEPPPNPFLTPRVATDPPPPWVGSVGSATKRRRGRRIAVLVVAALALAAGIVLCVSPRARSRAAHAGAHVTKTLARR